MLRMLKRHKNHVAVGLDSASALVVNGDEFETLSSVENAYAYKVFYQNNNVIECKLEKYGKLYDLLNKQ